MSKVVIMSLLEANVSNYCRDKLTDDQKKQLERITEYFDENNADTIASYFETRAKRKETMARYIIKVCCEVICALNCQVHIINQSFRNCLLHYSKWRTHIESNDQSLCIKMSHNCRILAHQVIQMNKFYTSDNSNEWKKKLLQKLNETGYTDPFLDFFLGMLMKLIMTDNYNCYTNNLLIYI